MKTQQEKAREFRALHEAPGCFVIPNPWDAGSARLFETLGFRALATTSSGFAMTLGRLDGQVNLDEKLEHCRQLCHATDIPVSADLEHGFAESPEGVAKTIAAAAQTGLAGGSIEDFSRHEIYEFSFAVERVQAAVEAVRGLEVPFVLTARAENLIRGRDDLEDTLRRLEAYQDVGADVLYAPGLRTLVQVREFTSQLERPLNVLGPHVEGATIAELADAGAKRVSVGGAIAFATISRAVAAGRELLDEGGFGWLPPHSSLGEMQKLLTRHRSEQPDENV